MPGKQILARLPQDPTPNEIRSRAKAIRAKWTEEERLARKECCPWKGGWRFKPREPAVVETAEYLITDLVEAAKSL